MRAAIDAAMCDEGKAPNTPAQVEEGRITGAIHQDGKVILFDASDYTLEPGTEAVIIDPKGRIAIAKLEQTAEWERLARSRTGLVWTVNPFGERVLFGAKVLGRHIHTEEPRPAHPLEGNQIGTVPGLEPALSGLVTDQKPGDWRMVPAETCPQACGDDEAPGVEESPITGHLPPDEKLLVLIAECDGWERVLAQSPKDLKATMEVIWRLLEIKKRRGIRPHVEKARQIWLRKRQRGWRNHKQIGEALKRLSINVALFFLIPFARWITCIARALADLAFWLWQEVRP